MSKTVNGRNGFTIEDINKVIKFPGEGLRVDDVLYHAIEWSPEVNTVEGKCVINARMIAEISPSVE